MISLRYKYQFRVSWPDRDALSRNGHEFFLALRMDRGEGSFAMVRRRRRGKPDPLCPLKDARGGRFLVVCVSRSLFPSHFCAFRRNTYTCEIRGPGEREASTSVRESPDLAEFAAHAIILIRRVGVVRPLVLGPRRRIPATFCQCLFIPFPAIPSLLTVLIEDVDRFHRWYLPCPPSSRRITRSFA